jgi:aspartyl-tRNA(Asn)/glutamyl-tRNA(Gln) amidotransferase subunit A
VCRTCRLPGGVEVPAAAPTELLELSVLELAQAYRERDLSPIDVTQACLNRIAETDAAINAFCLVDAEAALDAARRAEDRFLRDSPLGPLDGVPVAIKDLLLTRGWPTLRGSRLVDRDSQAWQDDAPAVARLRGQGAVLVGKTTTSEFGWKATTDGPLTGVTRNPHDPRMTAGGSSGGSAAAVASHMVPLALGTDGGGSIRIPAAFCGVFGLKPTVGAVPQWPASPFGPLTHVGPIARNARDAAVMLQAIAGPSRRDVNAGAVLAPREPEGLDLSGLRVAFAPSWADVDVQADVAALVAGAVAMLARAGADVSQVNPGFDDVLAAFETFWYAGAARVVAGVDGEHHQHADQGFLEIADQGSRLSGADYVAAWQRRSGFAAEVEQFLSEFDVLVTPTVPIDAFEAGQEVPAGWPNPRWTSWTPFTYPFNLSGSPAASVPCGLSARGLPVALQIIGKRGDDWLVLAVAAAYERAMEPTLAVSAARVQGSHE